MKNVILIILLAIATSSCNLFQKPSMNQEEIDAMVAKNQSLENQLQECENLESQLASANAQIQQLSSELSALQEATKGKFQVIVGAFKVPSNAEDYSRTIVNMGYEGKIVAGPFGFDLVTFSSHETLMEALRSLDDARINVIETAWIYIRR
jgi:hypothetical protein